MATNKKPRKKYQPKYTINDPISYVVGGTRPIDAGTALDVKSINHSSMLALVQGRGTRVDWDYVCAALNISLALAKDGIGSDWIMEIDAAMQAHAQCGRRQVSHGVFGYTGEQLTAVNLGLEIHDVQLDNTRVVQLERAHVKVRKDTINKNFKHRVKETA